VVKGVGAVVGNEWNWSPPWPFVQCLRSDNCMITINYSFNNQIVHVIDQIHQPLPPWKKSFDRHWLRKLLAYLRIWPSNSSDLTLLAVVTCLYHDYWLYLGIPCWTYLHVLTRSLFTLFVHTPIRSIAYVSKKCHCGLWQMMVWFVIVAPTI